MFCRSFFLQFGFTKAIYHADNTPALPGVAQLLDKMAADWQPIMFDILPYKDTACNIMKVSDEVSQLLDDHIVLTQSMNFSPYKKAFEDRIYKWEQTLRITQASESKPCASLR